MRSLSLVSLSALALTGCAMSDTRTAATPVATATAVAYAPVIPSGTEIGRAHV